MYRVCFVSPLSRPVLEPKFQCDFGGAEVRAVNFATGLATYPEFDVSMVLRSYRREASRGIENFTAHFERVAAPIPRVRELTRDHTFPWKLVKSKFRKAYHSWAKKRQGPLANEPQVIPLLTEIPTDTLCCFAANRFSANVIKSAAASGKNSVLFIASSQDLDAIDDRATPEQNDFRRYVMQNAHSIVCQTAIQQQWLKERFDRDATLIRNPIGLSQSVKTTDTRKHVLWIGRADALKRADTMMEIADLCPEVSFTTIINKRNFHAFESTVSNAPANVRIVERVPYNEVEAYFANAKALLSTSVTEGFPNAFLQAGKYGVPVFSLHVDPEQMISMHGCGRTSQGNVKRMAQLLSNMWQQQDPQLHQTQSENIRRYVKHFHAFDDRVAELRSHLLDVSSSLQRKAA